MNAATEPSWVRESREEAARASSRLGLPDRSHEDWKHVVPSDLLPECAEADEGGIVLAATESVLPEAWARLVFAGGRFRPELSLVPESTTDWTILPLSDAVVSRSREAASLLGSCEPADHALMARARESWTDGLFLDVAEGRALPGPVQILDVGSGSSCLRHLVALGPSSRATVVETHVAPDSATGSRTVTEARLSCGSRLEHVRAQTGSPQSISWNAIAARIAGTAALEARHFGLGGRLTRSEFHADLEEPGADFRLEGLVAAHGEDVADALASVRHLARDCTSNQLWKALAQDRSTASFTGGIHVAKGADGTSAMQSSRNILLARGATIHSRPQLEIWADDVKCSHGSATGRLDEKALFFLRSRGLSALDARRVLVKAFADEILGKRPWESTRMRLEALLGTRI